MNVLAIGSHPDDIEFGCGGTIHKLTKKGHHVSMLVLTEGGVGGDPGVRRREQLRSAASMGIVKIYWGNFEDTRLSFSDRIIPEIERVIKQVHPSFVFVHYNKDTHQDHRYLSDCTVVAARNIPNVLFYEVPSTIDFMPNVFVDVQKVMKLKLKSLTCHRSQVMKTNVESQSILDIAKATAMFRGTQCRMHMAEAFCSLRMFFLM
jgi:LmbE family N-acetylglucosaminyl deacetylase